MLVVSGEAPCLNMRVSLEPLIYLTCPEYWRIEVVGRLPEGFCQRGMKPYTETISLEGLVGSAGVEIAGSNKTEQAPVGGGCDSNFQADRGE